MAAIVRAGVRVASEYWDTRPKTMLEAIGRMREQLLEDCRRLGASVASTPSEVALFVARSKQRKPGEGSGTIGRGYAVSWPQQLLTSSPSKKRVEDMHNALATLGTAEMWHSMGEEGLAALELISVGQYCQKTFWRQAEPWVERGMRQVAQSRAGHALAYGTSAQLAARRKKLHQAWIKRRRAGHRVLDCDRIVASRFDVSVRTVQRARGLK